LTTGWIRRGQTLNLLGIISIQVKEILDKSGEFVTEMQKIGGAV